MPRGGSGRPRLAGGGIVRLISLVLCPSRGSDGRLAARRCARGARGDYLCRTRCVHPRAECRCATLADLHMHERARAAPGPSGRGRGARRCHFGARASTTSASSAPRSASTKMLMVEEDLACDCAAGSCARGGRGDQGAPKRARSDKPRRPGGPRSATSSSASSPSRRTRGSRERDGGRAFNGAMHGAMTVPAPHGYGYLCRDAARRRCCPSARAAALRKMAGKGGRARRLGEPPEWQGAAADLLRTVRRAVWTQDEANAFWDMLQGHPDEDVALDGGALKGAQWASCLSAAAPGARGGRGVGRRDQQELARCTTPPRAESATRTFKTTRAKAQEQDADAPNPWTIRLGSITARCDNTKWYDVTGSNLCRADGGHETVTRACVYQ